MSIKGHICLDEEGKKQSLPSLCFVFLGVWFVTRCFLALYLFLSDVGLMPDEAQYWTWSRDLSLGYYSKPPGIAWQIALSTSLFPSLTEFSVRFISFAVLPLLCAYFLFKSLKVLTKDEVAAYFGGIIYLLSPLGFFGSVFATTDGMMLVAIFGAIYSYLRGLDKQYFTAKDLLTIAFWISLGALWKWTSYLLIPLLLIDSKVLFGNEKTSVKSRLYRISIVSTVLFLGLAPSFIWNAQHDWVTFRHVEGNLVKYEGGQFNPNPLEFFFASTSLVSWGFMLIGVIFGCKHIFSEKEDGKKQFLKRLLIGISLLWGGLLLLSFFSRVQGNWALIANGAFFVFVGLGIYYVISHRSFSPQKKGLILYSSIFFSLFTQLFAFCIHMAPYDWAVRISPLRQGIGMREGIQNALLKMEYSYADIAAKKVFLFSDRYQNIAQLEFYAPSNPSEIFFFNIHGIRLNQYSFRSFDRELYTGADGLFVAIIPFRECNMLDMRVKRFQEQLAPYFLQVSFVGLQQLKTVSGLPVRAMLLFRCERYNGKDLPEVPLPTY